MSEMSCGREAPDLSGVETVEGQTTDRVGNFRSARELAEAEAGKRFIEYLLISWYDRERDFESPAHVSECGGCGPKQGYIHYALSRGARLQVEVDGGRFVFFFTPVEW
jgi:hypothetical protein